MKTLVIYGTRWGGTTSVAEKIGLTLKEEGFTVDVVDAKQSPKNIEGYQLCIVGSGIRADKWTKETLNFLGKNADALKKKETALFVSCQMADRPEKEICEKAKNQYLKQIAQLYGLQPVSYGFFGGFMDFSQSHGLIVDIMIRVNRKGLEKNGLDTRKVHDTRNWFNIVSWAHETAKLIKQK